MHYSGRVEYSSGPYCKIVVASTPLKPEIIIYSDTNPDLFKTGDEVEIEIRKLIAIDPEIGQ